MKCAAATGKAVAIALGVSLACAGCQRPSSAADRLNAQAEARFLALEFGAAMDLWRQALHADPTYLPAVIQMYTAQPNGATLDVAALLDSVASRLTDTALAACYRRLSALNNGYELPLPTPGSVSEDAQYCEQYNRAVASVVSDSVREAAQRRLADRYPSSTQVARWLLDGPDYAGRYDEMARVAKSLTAPDRPPYVRAMAYAQAVRAEHERGRHTVAARLERAVRSDPAWELPGFRTVWATEIGSHYTLRRLAVAPGDTALARHVDSMTAAAEAIRLEAARSGGDLRGRLAVRLSVAIQRLDRGRIDDAVEMLEALKPMSDSMGDLGNRAYVRMRLGRAYVKRGRLPDAERELLLARQIGAEAAMPIVQKEVEHNLLHLYESQKRDADALAAGRAFARYADMGGLHPVRMMSRRDLGLFLRSRGALADSRHEFERMMADIDSLGVLGGAWFYAGEYQELSGDLGSARRYYERAIQAGAEPIRALEGLVRVHLALGDTVTALAMARSHDGRRDAAGRPESAPLLPGVLSIVATPDSARSAYSVARRIVDRHGQVAAWAALTADLAALELRNGGAARAASLADSARSAASAVGATATVLRARAIESFARWCVTRDVSALRDLQAAVRDGEVSGGPLLRADLHRMLARALAMDGRWREALAWYARAAAPLDSMARAIPLDAQQAGFRAAQRGVYNEALTTILANAQDPDAVAAWLEWSTRRKERTYGVELGSRAVARRPRPGPGVAIVDYVLLDSTVAALVVAPRETRIVSLGANAAAVRKAVQRMRRALDVRVGGALDLPRAAFPIDVAHELYGHLLRPLEPLLDGTHTLVVVPDGPLHLVPFDALVSDLPPNGRDERMARFVVDSRAVVQSVSPDVNEDSWRVAPHRVIAIAPSSPERAVPDSKAEVIAVRNAVHESNFSVLAGSEATVRAVLNAASSDAILHFIGHARASESDPGLSWISLSDEGAHGGSLEAWQVANAHVRSPLVVLSACETGGGRALDGEGVLSLSRSFLRAGAGATIATLWPIGPFASEFPAAFYEAIGHGATAPAAIRAAKLALRARGVPAFAWAPYQFASASPRGKASNR